INVEELPPIDISDVPPFVCNMGKNLRNKKKPSKTYKMRYHGALPIPLKNIEWAPNYLGCNTKEEGNGKWHVKKRLVDPFGKRIAGTHNYEAIPQAIQRGTVKPKPWRSHEEGFEVYFQGGLKNDDYFNANKYWVRIRSKDQLRLSRSATQTIRSPVLRVLQKMITYGLCQRTTGSMDATTLKEVIDPDGRLIAKDPAHGVQRIAIPRPPHLTLQDLSDRMGRMEIQQGVLKRMSRRQSYHSDRYTSVFEFMAGHYGVPLARDYAPPDYDEQQQL
nr:hypothetical protein [Tanacetum cinerariifolium]